MGESEQSLDRKILDLADKIRDLFPSYIYFFEDVPEDDQLVFNKQGDFFAVSPESIYRALIPILELEVAFCGDAEDFFYLGAAQRKLAQCLEGAEKDELYKQAISNLERAIDIEPWVEYYLELGKALSEYAEESEVTERITLLRKALENLGKVKDDRYRSAVYYWYLGQTQAELAEETFDIAEKELLRKGALAALRKSYSLDEDPETLESIEEIMSSETE